MLWMSSSISENPIPHSLPYSSGHTAFVYEDICRERMWNLSAENYWPFQFSKVGSWWDGKNEIDIAAIDPEGNNLVLGECKYWQEPVGVNILRELEAKSEKVDWQKKNRRVWYVLFSASGFTKELEKLATVRKDLLLFDDNSVPEF